MRCEGWTRHGGAFTFGPVYWAQCDNEAIVNIRFIDNQRSGKGDERTLPACKDCWQKCIDNHLEILEVVPIKELEENNG